VPSFSAIFINTV
jgi:hypothetical protein